MNRIRARLDRLLRLRHAELDKTRSELDGTSARLESLAHAHSTAQRRVDDTDRYALRTLESSAIAPQVRASHAAGTRARQSARAAMERHETGRLQVSDARHRVVEAWKRLRGLELLRDRRLRAEQRTAARRTQRDLDEVGERIWRERER